jgi:hypothetical protein
MRIISDRIFQFREKLKGMYNKCNQFFLKKL